MVQIADTSRFEEALQAHQRERGGQPLPPDVAQACVLILVAGPAEPGVDEQWNGVFQALRDHHPRDLPEACICRIWIDGADPTGKLMALLGQHLWEPARFMAYRALAHFGRRTTLASLLPHEGPLTQTEGDAWMEASRPESAPPIRVTREDSQWASLLEAELAPDGFEAALQDLAAKASPSPARTIAEAQTNRIAVRATAALARLHIARGAGGVLKIASASLPAWESAYLRGLTEWQRASKHAASEHLREALARNSQQTCVRLALSCLTADQSPEEALELTVHVEPTRDLLIHRAALLARLRRYDEAEQALAQNANWEAARCSWPRGQAELRRQEQLLRTALAERRGDWAEAERFWQSACSTQTGKALREARELFIARSRLEALTLNSGWARSFVESKANRLKSQITAAPLTGDASFFRSAALISTEPARALQDLQTLQRRRKWQEMDKAVGASRLTFIGDSLMRLGRPTEAAAAYRSIPGCNERLAIASVYSCLLRRAPREELIAAVDIAPQSPWPLLLAALALLIHGAAEPAENLLSAAEQSGALPEVCSRLRTLCAVVSGGRQLSRNELGTLGLRPEVSAAVGLVAEAGPEPARANIYVSTLGARWMELCPMSPQRVARRLLAAWCEEGLWKEALQFARELARSGLAWGKELADLTRVRYALDRGNRAELAAAEEGLRKPDDGTIS